MCSFITLTVCICTCLVTCRTQEDTGNCDYSYLLQPPSELPCDPYQSIGTISVSLECIVAQSKKNNELLNGKSEICWVQMLGDSEPQGVEQGGSFSLSTSSSVVEKFVIFQSVLAISEVYPSNGSHIYWCELSTADKLCNSSISSVFVNRVTIHESEFYATLPPCPKGTAFHLAETVCVNNESVNLDSPVLTTSCPPDGDCSGEDAGDSQTVVPLRTVVIAVVVTGIGVPVLLAVVIVVPVLIMRGRRRKKENQRVDKSKAGRASSVSLETHVASLEQEENQTPPTSIPVHEVPDENHTITAASERQPRTSTPRPVIPQRPCRMAIFPPTDVQAIKTPISARKRALSLFRQLQRPHKGVGVKSGDAVHSETDCDDHTNKQQGPTPRKKPYKTLELDTVEVPHLYMTRAKSPRHSNRPRRHPPVLLQNQSRTKSREKLLLTETMSSGYVVPNDAEAQHAMYKEIEPETQDYLALYTVPRQRNSSTSSEEHPIYEEPRQN